MRTLSTFVKVLLLWTGCCTYCYGAFDDKKNSSLNKIAGYEAKSLLVIDKSRIDLDQVELKKYLALGTQEGFEKAKKIYERGIYSHPVATLKITGGVPKKIDHGNLVIGMTDNHKAVYSTVTTLHKVDGNNLVVAYDSSSIRGKYIPCEVGGSPHPFTEGCFKSKGSVIVENHGTFDYEYDILAGNSNGVSLYGFSEHEAEKMFKCKHDCPYPDYEKFYNYYGQLDYGDLWIQAAFAGRSTNFGATKFDRGNVDFSLLSWTARAEAIHRATVYLNVFIQVYRTMQEFAIEHCRAGTPTEVGHWNDPVTNWDNAVAIYTGSLEGTEGTGNGHLLYTLADETCAAFKTCGEERKNTSGTSSVNLEIFSHFQDGQGFLENGECEFAQGKKDRIIQLMTVPLIQGTIRSAYILANGSADDDQQKGAALAFAAAILPDVHFCSPDDATIIYDQLRISRTDNIKFLDVKLAFERNYECLGVTCADIGGYYDSNKGRYFKNAEPCGSRKNRGGGSANRNGSNSVFSFWRVAGMLGGLFVLGAAFQSRERILDIVANSRGISGIIDRMGGNNEYELGDSSRYSRLVPETAYQNLGDSGRFSQNLGDSGRFSQNLGGAGGGTT